MADGAAPFQSTRDRHAMGDFREHLVVDPQPTATKSPRLSAYYHKNKFVIEIKTNVPADMNGRERGIVRAELDPHVFYTFIDAFEKLIQENKPSYAKRIRIKRPDFQKTNGGEPVTEPNPNIDYITCDACKRPVLIRTLNIHCGHHRSFDCCSECYSIMYNHECPEICEEEEEE
jgi:hypothetical protein